MKKKLKKTKKQLRKQSRLSEQDIMIVKAEKMLDDNIDNEFWNKELDTLLNEKMLIENNDPQWQ